MIKEEKKLLFRDLCARLPYHVRCKIWLKDGTTEEGPLDLEHNYADVLLNAFYYDDIKDIKPYLRPMSSMTDEEKVEYENTFASVYDVDDYGEDADSWHEEFSIHSLDWLNKNHFDYRGLIEKGLAIEVTEENNPYEK